VKKVKNQEVDSDMSTGKKLNRPDFDINFGRATSG
jgi:hypothetical protein